MQGFTRPDTWITPVFHLASSLHYYLQQTGLLNFFAVLLQVSDIMAEDISGWRPLSSAFLLASDRFSVPK